MEKAAASLAKAKLAYEQTAEEMAAVLLKDEEPLTDVNEATEAGALEAFMERVEELEELIEEMTVFRTVHIGLGNLRNDVSALQESMDVDPDKDYQTAISDTGADPGK